MDILNDVKDWLNSEFPSQEEIKETIDRLSMNAGSTKNPAERFEFKDAIELLKKELGKEPQTLSSNSKNGVAAFPSSIREESPAPIKAKPLKANGSRAASPIKDKTDIKMIAKMMSKWNFQREAHLLIIGCNTALRYSDLRMMRFDQVIHSAKNDGTAYIEQIVEKKTGKAKRLILNRTAMKYITAQYESLKGLGIENPIYVFQGTGNRTKAEPKPVSRSHVNQVFKHVREDMDLDFRLSTHTMRKTFGYHAYDNGKGIDIKILQKLFNHASEQDTFIYIGVNAQRVQEAYITAEIEIDL